MKEILRAHENYYLYKDGSFRFTQKGIIYYRPGFAHIGIDIRSIKTLDDFTHAIRQSRRYESNDITKSLDSCKDQLQADVLRAVLTGNYEESDRLMNKIKKRTSIGLRIVK